MKTGKIILQTVAFLLVLMIVVFAVPGRILAVSTPGNYGRVKGFYAERPGSLDAVFIGASNVHSFWQPAIGWQTHGIAVYNLSFDSMPIMCSRYLIEEARKKQPDALYIINLNNFKSRPAADALERFHGTVDYMPLSLEKIRFIREVAAQAGFSTGEQLELLFPFIRFHSRWSSLRSWSYGTQETKYKGSLTKKEYFRNAVDASKAFKLYSDARTEPKEDAMQVFTDLLDYLDREHVNALFVKVPQAVRQDFQGRMNVLEEVLESRGYPCLDMLNDYETVGINPRRDYYNTYHTNIRGAYKLTEYMANYLVEHYHFADKRGQAGYEDWDTAGRDYDKLIDSWILPFDREKHLWQDLPAPKIKEAKAKRSGIRLTWSASKGADGYVIYRKTSSENDGHWKLLATVGTGKLSYADKALKKNTKYTYVVAPFCNVDGQKAYGNYSINGVSCRSPKNLGQSSEQEKTGGDGN